MQGVPVWIGRVKGSPGSQPVYRLTWTNRIREVSQTMMASVGGELLRDRRNRRRGKRTNDAVYRE
jgi:hypothetical protein